MRHARSLVAIAGLAFFGGYAIAGGALEALLAQDPVAEASRAFAAGDRRLIVVPICGSEPGESIPGWPLEDPAGAMRAIDLGKRPISCADFGDDPQNRKFVQAGRYAERYNRKLLELGGTAGK